MRSFMGRRGPRVVGDLYIHPRQDVGTLDRDSDSEDEGIESDDPETPSPTQTTFPTNSPTSSPSETGRLAGLPSVTVNPGSETALPQTSPNSGDLGASVGFAQNKVQEPELSQNADQSGQMSRSVVIAMGTIIGLAVLAIVIFTLWICRRRRNRANAKRTSKLRPFLCRRDSTYQPGMPAAPPDAKTQSKVMDDIIAAAYAAENGYAWETGSKRSSGSSLWREKQEASAQFASRKPNEDSKSLYVRQITSGFWRKSPQEGAGNIRAPPSVAGKTEMTSQSGATESTWNTWGVAQHPKKPKEDWIKRCIRLGGAK